MFAGGLSAVRRVPNFDFNGDYTGTWGQFSPGSTPAYDQDGDGSSAQSPGGESRHHATLTGARSG